VKIAARILIGVVVTALTIWGAAMFYFSPLLAEPWRAFAAGAYAAITLLAFLFLPRRRRTLLISLCAFALLVFLFFQIPASNERDWQTDVSVTPHATIKGDSSRFTA
jgi:hypothetical protein